MQQLINHNASIFVAGHRGMVGSALVRRLHASGYHNVVTATRDQVDLTQQSAVREFFEGARPDYVFLAAAKVGGIHANRTYVKDFIYDNLAIETNVISSAASSGVKGLMLLGSSCIYPRDCPQPIREEYLLTGPLELTNEYYAIAKIAGIKLCEAFNRQLGTEYVSVMPTNLFGPNDNYDLETSHVLPALIRKAHEARLSGAASFTVWGSGTPGREFLYVDDLADACVFLMERGVGTGMFNIGTGKDITIRDLALLVAGVVGFTGDIVFDSSMPDGTPQKLLEISKMTALGWTYSTSLRQGIALTYQDYLKRMV